MNYPEAPGSGISASLRQARGDNRNICAAPKDRELNLYPPAADQMVPSSITWICFKKGWGPCSKLDEPVNAVNLNKKYSILRESTHDTEST
jgi:hypothetical protein